MGSKARPQKDGAPRKQIVSDKVCVDDDMTFNLGPFSNLLDTIVNDHQVNLIALSHDMIMTTAMVKPGAGGSASDFFLKTVIDVVISPMLVAGLDKFDTVVSSHLSDLSTVQGKSKEDNLSEALDKLVNLFPHINFGKLRYNVTCGLAATTEVDDNCAAGSDSSEASRSSRTTEGESEQTSESMPFPIRSELFMLFKDSNPRRKKRLLSIFAVKGCNSDNSKVIARGVLHPSSESDQAQDKGYRRCAISSSNCKPLRDFGQSCIFTIAKQCFTTMAHHVCPVVLVPVGLTYVFLRFDHKSRKKSLAADGCLRSSCIIA